MTIEFEPILKLLPKLERAIGGLLLLLLDSGKDILPLVDELLELSWSIRLALCLIDDGLAHAQLLYFDEGCRQVLRNRWCKYGILNRHLVLLADVERSQAWNPSAKVASLIGLRINAEQAHLDVRAVRTLHSSHCA